MRNLSVYLKELERDLQEGGSKIRGLISGLEMWLQELSTVELLEMFKDDCTKEYDLSLKLKTYFAGLTEYLYNLNKEKAPDWVFEYKLEKPELFYGTDCLVEFVGDWMIDWAMRDSVKEFRDRNLALTSLLDAV